MVDAASLIMGFAVGLVLGAPIAIAVVEWHHARHRDAVYGLCAKCGREIKRQLNHRARS